MEGVPEGGAVTLPREAVVRWLEEAGEEPEANGDRRPEVADLTVAELAEKLGKSESTVRSWMPDVPGAYRLGNEWRVSREDWRAYLDGLAEEQGEEPATVRSAPGSDLDDWREERS